MTKATFVWIATRDGTLHATQPPIIADGQHMLCGRTFARRDLRVSAPSTAGQLQATACAECRDHILADGAAALDAAKTGPTPPEM